MIADMPSVRAGLYKAVPSCVARDDGAVLWRTEVVSPRGRRVRLRNEILLVLLVKVAVLHDHSS
ncbi:hypothetical protein D3C81_1703030 [compost metagenome]